MSWRWEPNPEAAQVDQAALGLDLRFPSQGEAESWLGEFYPDLADAGVTAVTLYEEDRLVYGPMSLEAG